MNDFARTIPLRWEGVYLGVDRPRPMARELSAFIGDRRYLAGGTLVCVHVMSIHAGGEVRGYFLVDGKLRLRLPCYGGEWVEMDAAVSAALGAPVVSYRLDASGMGEEMRVAAMVPVQLDLLSEVRS
jgi:hypothetical protein